uniref:Copper transport protein n=1 Tax=Acrobeloides nanus TaxID=290746 RepID=A0A914DH10_9BILA
MPRMFNQCPQFMSYKETITIWPCGAMDNASVYGTEDCSLEQLFHNLLSLLICKRRKFAGQSNEEKIKLCRTSTTFKQTGSKMDHTSHVHGHHMDMDASTTDNPSTHPNHDMGHMHAMSFHIGSHEVILFDFWNTESSFGIIVSSFVIILLCFIMETIRWLRVYRKQNFLSNPENQQIRRRRFDIDLAGDSVLHAVQLTLSYMLMLIFMTFNVWLCIAVVVGEVSAHLMYRILFPNLERLNDILANTETCCG